MKIVQILPELKYGDAVGNDAVAVCNVISEMGYETGIYAEKIDESFDYDLLLYFALALVALLFVEWWLQSREYF